ncbi:hypothetical protein ACHWQZ_G001091 [Mnemiopsis leidyi]
MKCFFALPVLLLPVVYGLQCCNTTNSDGTGYSNTSTPDLNVTDQLSVCLWVRPLQDEEYDVVSYSEPSGESVLYISSRQAIFYNNKAANISTYDDSKSTHICVTWHKDKGVTTFINGKQSQDTTRLFNFTNKVDFTGSWTAGLQRTKKPYPSAGGLNGSLCGLTIWPIAINSDYVLELFSGSGDYSVAGDTKTDDAKEEKNEEEEREENVDEKQPEQKVNVTNPNRPAYSWKNFNHYNYSSINDSFCIKAPARSIRDVTDRWVTPVMITEHHDPPKSSALNGSSARGNGIRLGSLDPVASKFVILFLVIIGVIIGFAGLFMCSEREIAVKRAQKRLKDEENFSIGSTHSVT